MIWAIDGPLRDLLPLVDAAGDPDQQIIDAFVATLPMRRQHPPKHAGVKRWYYLLLEDPRVSISCVGVPLDTWHGGAMVKIGTHEIIGEFPPLPAGSPGNQHLVGRQGLRLQCEPLAWLKDPADRDFASVAQMLAEISMQVLDLGTPARWRHHHRPVVRGQRNFRPPRM